MLLDGLQWRVAPGQHWLIAGGNGAGKSTLSRLLARADPAAQGARGALSVLGEGGADGAAACADGAATAMASGSASEEASEEAAEPRARAPTRRERVGWVSTELHLSLARSDAIAQSLVDGADGEGDGAVKGAGEGAAVGAAVCRWLGLGEGLLRRPFRQLSQGEQKMVLLAAALAARPRLLVLDEPAQGLDLVHRERMLATVQQVCAATATGLVYITHHYEEVLPCVTHVLLLKQGNAAFCGEREAYEESHLGLRK